MGNHGLFTLFVLVNLDHKTINDLLAAANGPYAPCFWLATDNYDNAAKKQRNVSDGTKPPISENFKSPWIGRPINDLTEWLMAKPKDTDIDERHFAVLDKGARGDSPTIVTCRIGDMDGQGNELFLLRMDSMMRATEHMKGAPEDVWDEMVRIEGNAEIEYDGEV